ncbi:MAG: Rv2175c family DNA-binding protein [Actinomycetaceae bacterium]|nr:Rv2175c family DNA-binding protein [Actinomycetaceae bacterium]
MECYPLPDVATMLGVPFPKVRQYVRDHRLLSMSNDEGITCVPAPFLRKVDDGFELVDDVAGTAIILMDGGFSQEEACLWMISEQDLLKGDVPIEVIRNGGYHRVNRVASMMAF